MVPLGHIAAVKLGKMLDRSKHKSGRKLPYLRNINVRWGAIDTSDLLEMFFKDSAEEEKYSVRPSDVLVCEGGEPGRASVWTGGETELKYQKALHRVRFHEPYEPKLLVYFLEWMASTGRLEEFFTGSTIKHFTRQSFVTLPVPNPPLPEQRRIVNRIEELFSRLDAGVAALRHAKAQLQRYRQSVLAAAVTGELTREWREQHPETERAEELLERTLSKRREAWRVKARYKEPVGFNKHPTFDLPESWTWASIDQLMLNITDGDHQAPPQTDTGVPFLVIGNIRSRSISFEGSRFVGEDYYKGLDTFRTPSRGDILYSLVGSFGIAVTVETAEPFCVQRHIGILRPHSASPAAFLTRILNSRFVYNQASEVSTGTAQKTVPLSGLRKIAGSAPTPRRTSPNRRRSRSPHHRHRPPRSRTRPPNHPLQSPPPIDSGSSV